MKTIRTPRLGGRVIAGLVSLSVMGAFHAFAEENDTSEILAQQQDAQVLAPIEVDGNKLETTTEGSGSYTTGNMRSATGLGLSVRETPQSVSVVSQERMKDQNMSEVVDAIKATPGISYRQWDRGRGGVSARGFAVSKFYLDGVPYISSNGELEKSNSAMFDRVEFVRGANGLMSGVGDPSAAINMVRKHADSRELEASINGEVGSWKHKSVTVDVSSPLFADGDVRGRVVVSRSQAEAYIDLEETENTLFYAVIDADITEQTRLSVGASREKDERNGMYWGGLPYYFSDGSHTNFPRSKTNATDWSFWDTDQKNVFAEIVHTFSNKLELKVYTSASNPEEESHMIWMYDPAYGTATVDKVTGLGMVAEPYWYKAAPERSQSGFSLSGPFAWLGKEHTFTLGYITAKDEGEWSNGIIDPSSPFQADQSVGNLLTWNGVFPKPVYNGRMDYGDWERTEKAFYASTRLTITEKLKTIIGARVTDYEVKYGASIWSPAEEYKNDGELTPYFGVLYDLDETFTAYISYASIFTMNEARDKNGDMLDPATGDVYEVGIKGEHFDGAVNSTFAIYKTRQDNFGVIDGTNLVPGTSMSAYKMVDGIRVDGYEVELQGSPVKEWDVSVGWSVWTAEDPQGSIVQDDQPRQTFKFFNTYDLAKSFAGWKVGGGVVYESAAPQLIANPATGVDEKLNQARAIWDLMASYEVNEQLSVQANIYNVFDKEYRDAGWGTYVYGEPRNFVISADYKF